MKQNRTGKLPFLPGIAGLMVLVPVLVAAACTGNTPALGGPSPDGTRWALTGYHSGGQLIAPLAGTTVTLEFSKDNSITGSAGCNRYLAGYVLKGTKITIGQAVSTEMYCMGSDVMEQEQAYLALLSQAASVTSGDDRLTFTDAQGTPILSFARIVPPAPEPLAGTNWTLDSFHTGDAVSSVISGTTITAVFDAEGRVSGSAGCNHFFGSYTVTGSSLAISSLGSTKMNCPGRGIMLQEGTYLASLGRTAGFTIRGNRLSLSDANGTMLLSFTKGA